MPSTIDCKKAIPSLIDKAVKNDVDEILLRISMFDHNLDPYKWQAIAKFSNREKPWGVAVDTDPNVALYGALKEAERTYSEEKNETHGTKTPNKSRVLRGKPKRRTKPASPKSGAKIKKPLRSGKRRTKSD